METSLLTRAAQPTAWSRGIWLSRVMVCTILAKTHQVGPIRSRNFYDDITSRISSKEATHLAETLVSHGGRLAGHLKDAKLKYRKKKTVVLASKNTTGKKIVEGMKAIGVDVKLVQATRDVGLDAGAGIRRSTKTQKARATKATQKL